ncbi:MAG: GNAT family N-acetyltransferase [Nostoc sp.]|uniref:GNAT family N-acetyltransferase n=1 Tax=Nostoc sp. TaxID=1180 RepID=UPI002FEFC438
MESDWQAVHKYASDHEVVRYLTFGPNSEEDTKNFLQKEISLQGEEPRQHFALAVTLKAQKQLIGICRIFTLDTGNKIGSIGYCFSKEFCGQGYATEAVKVVVSFGFQELALHRIFATSSQKTLPQHEFCKKLECSRKNICENTIGLRENGETLGYMRSLSMNEEASIR